MFLVFCCVFCFLFVCLTTLCHYLGLPSRPLHTSKIFLQRSEEVADDRHAPRPAQQSLPRQAAHVGDVGIVDGEAEHPFHLSAPQDVLFLVHEDGEMLVFALLYGVRPRSNGPHFAELEEKESKEEMSRRPLLPGTCRRRLCRKPTRPGPAGGRGQALVVSLHRPHRPEVTRPASVRSHRPRT